jgi:hypothetical protein
VDGSYGISIPFLGVALLEDMPMVGLQWFDQCFSNSVQLLLVFQLAPAGRKPKRWEPMLHLSTEAEHLRTHLFYRDYYYCVPVTV